VAAEERGFLTKSEDLGGSPTGGRRTAAARGVLEALVPADPGKVVLVVDHDLVEGDDVPIFAGGGAGGPVFAIGAQQEQGVARIQLGGGAGEIEATWSGLGARGCPGNACGDGQGVPVRLGENVGGGLEGLRSQVLLGDALDLCAGRYGDG